MREPWRLIILSLGLSGLVLGCASGRRLEPVLRARGELLPAASSSVAEAWAQFTAVRGEAPTGGFEIRSYQPEDFKSVIGSVLGGASEDADKEESTSAVLQLLGFLDPAQAATAAVQGLLKAEVAGLYLPRDHLLALRASDSAVIRKVTLAHELAHAYQDARFGLLKFQDLSRPEGIMARRSILEGDATFLSLLATLPPAARTSTTVYLGLERYLGALPMSALRTSVPAQADAAGVANDVMYDYLSSAYVDGATFFLELGRLRSTEVIAHVFQNPPTWGGPILDPQLYLAGRGELKFESLPAPEGAEWEEEVGSLDPLELRAMLCAVMPRADATAQVGGYRGGAVLLARFPGRAYAVGAAIELSTRAQARAVGDGLERLAAHWTRTATSSGQTPRPALVRVDGTRVVLVRGVEGPPATRWLDELGRVKTRPEPQLTPAPWTLRRAFVPSRGRWIVGPHEALTLGARVARDADFGPDTPPPDSGMFIRRSPSSVQAWTVAMSPTPAILESLVGALPGPGCPRKNGTNPLTWTVGTHQGRRTWEGVGEFTCAESAVVKPVIVVETCGGASLLLLTRVGGAGPMTHELDRVEFDDAVCTASLLSPP